MMVSETTLALIGVWTMVVVVNSVLWYRRGYVRGRWDEKLDRSRQMLDHLEEVERMRQDVHRQP